MFRYLLRRVLIFIPTLFVITLISFVISLNAPGDPVEMRMRSGDGDAQGGFDEKAYLRKRAELGLDLPLFYFSLSSQAYPDTLYRIPYAFERQALDRLIATYGNWEQISEYYQSARLLENICMQPEIADNDRDFSLDMRITTQELRRSADAASIESLLGVLDSIARPRAEKFPQVQNQLSTCRTRWETVKSQSTPWKAWIPAFHWYGIQSQYHRWLTNLVRLDFGRSLVDDRPVSARIADALPWSLLMNVLSMLLAYIIAIPIGVYSVRNRNTIRDKTVTTLLFVLYSLPAFWVATLMIQFLCNPEYLHLFPTSGVMSDQNYRMAFLPRMLDYLYHMILPTICFTYSSLAFLSRQMRVGMLEVVNQDYIRTARAKGLSERSVIWKHALRNSLLPIITQFANVFPAMFSGSIVLERIFSIPGIGTLLIQSYGAKDHPVIIANFFIVGLLTLVGILVADVLYAVADPRISFTRK